MNGIIAAGGEHTVNAGAYILQKGGNAVDAAIAATFASFVSEVGVVHLGGSGFANIYDSQNGRSLVYDFFSAMPGLEGNKHSDKSLDFNSVEVDFGSSKQSFFVGRASVAVPGNIAGLCQMAADHGRLPLEILLEPAISLATDGISIAKFQADTCKLLGPIFTHTPEMQEIFAPNGHIVKSQEFFKIPGLAFSLEQLAQEGVKYARRENWTTLVNNKLFRNHGLAYKFINDQRQNGGLIRALDLVSYNVFRFPSIRISYREYEILLPPPCSTGGILTAFSLNLLNRINFKNVEFGSVQHAQIFREVMAATLRARPYWDNAIGKRSVSEAIAYFLSNNFINRFFNEIKHALINNKPTSVVQESNGAGNTSHLSVIDKDGLAVSITTTAGETAGFIVPETGFIPNNILGESDLNPNGFHNWEPGVRIPTMMSPTIVLKSGVPFLVVGSGGSERIRSAIIQVLINYLDFKMSLNEAVNAPRFHLDATSAENSGSKIQAVLQCEFGFQEEILNQLENIGYDVNRWPVRSIYFGGAHSVSRTADGRLVAAGDNRRGGATAVA
ncbi:gamma-glutamyltransferase family protein [Candidatus Leptofilum sp.]|uniref:gamma-glutamyltransferase family protein n=1 Tax=Candidatus Leptofilum sp. TaxID=3241576 RepID=UPI003B5A0957